MFKHSTPLPYPYDMTICLSYYTIIIYIRQFKCKSVLSGIFDTKVLILLHSLFLASCAVMYYTII